MKFTKGFWITLAITTLLFVLPTVSTFREPASDGIRKDGFPLVFNTAGGFCPNGCIHSVSYLNLIVDILILIIAPFIVNFIVLKIKK